MFLIVRENDNVIVGSALKPIDLNDAQTKGYIVYEVDDSEYTNDLMGSKIEYFEIDE